MTGPPEQEIIARGIAQPWSDFDRQAGSIIGDLRAAGFEIISAAERARSKGLEGALRRLVRLKDGPRDAAYLLAKPLAWRQAREALATYPAREDDPDLTDSVKWANTLHQKGGF